ncbi:MAG: ABC transporter ATP-binding protein [Bacteriovoracaceae bacterium]
MSKLIEVKSIGKSFDSKQVLKNISFSVEEGSFYALLGENGAGKSTILRILMGAETVDRGEATMMGYDIYNAPAKIKETIGYVSENINFELPLTAAQVADHYQEFYPYFDMKMFTRLVKERRFDLNKKYQEYSRGQKMQFILMLSLSIGPKLLLIDEVTSVLDIYARKYFMTLLHQFVQNGGTVIMTTNIIAEIQNYATNLVMLKDGKVHINSPIKDIPKFFIKIRKTKDRDHDIFNDRECYWAGENTDGSNSYIIPQYLKARYQLTDEFYDRRTVQLDDIFIYFFNVTIETETEDKNEKAA